jgi:hypothetical protein
MCLAFEPLHLTALFSTDRATYTGLQLPSLQVDGLCEAIHVTAISRDDKFNTELVHSARRTGLVLSEVLLPWRTCPGTY